MGFVDNLFMPIALLTDFGTRDYYVAAMKGVILSIAPEVAIVDITHEVSPQGIREGAFILEACYRNFPAGTVFVAIIDPGVGSKRKPLAVSAGEYYFVAPDNGILSFLFNGAGALEAFEITNNRYMLPSPSSTFHGRDIFAPAAAHLAAGSDINDFGPPVFDPVVLTDLAPNRISDGRIAARVQHIDRFGNIITDLRPDDLQGRFEIVINGRTIDRFHPFFADAEFGEVFAMSGSAGFIEIAVRDGSAASKLNANPGDEVLLIKEFKESCK
jgi:S-adenosylmethionine hydrolase